jgi:membrane associated rhomboid family serine protease
VNGRYDPPRPFVLSGPLTPAVRTLLIANVVVWLFQIASSLLAHVRIERLFGLVPYDVTHHLFLWQMVTYMFLHGGFFHIFLNMLALWMFGTELERTWGTRFFTKFYLVTGVGAAATTLLLSLVSPAIYYSLTVGASGAIYGLLMAWAMYFPHRTILFWGIFPIPARVFVFIMGAIAFLSSLGGPGSGVAHIAHLGGLVVGYLYLKSLRVRPLDELRYRWLRWRMGKARSRFDVYSGGKSDDDWKKEWKKHIH